MPCFLAHTVEPRNKLRRQHAAEIGWCRTSMRPLPDSSSSICVFQLSIRSSRSTAKTPMLIDSTMFLVKLLQALELRNLLLQPSVELRILNSDADVAGQRLQQLHILARQEVARRPCGPGQ